MGIPVDTLGMKRGSPSPKAVFRLASKLRANPPDLLQTWMYHADLIGALAAKTAGNIPTVWNIRHSDLSPKANSRSTLVAARICAWLSPFLPKAILCCAESARVSHTNLGYSRDKIHIIPNGFDTGKFVPDSQARLKLTKDLRLPENAIIVGLVARYHPQKDHRNFIEAARIASERNPMLRFVLCGDRVDAANIDLVTDLEKSGLLSRVSLMGLREDIASVTAGFDIATSSSRGEGFPNAIGEAMSCAVPCVVTNVGDSALLVGDTGSVVPPAVPEALANAWHAVAELGASGRKALGLRARQRILDKFGLDSVARQYEEVYNSILLR